MSVLARLKTLDLTKAFQIWWSYTWRVCLLTWSAEFTVKHITPLDDKETLGLSLHLLIGFASSIWSFFMALGKYGIASKDERNNPISFPKANASGADRKPSD